MDFTQILGGVNPSSQSWPPRKRRAKYTVEACTECKRRKIKCSGGLPCRSCRSGRHRECTYGQPAPSQRKKSGRTLSTTEMRTNGVRLTSPSSELLAAPAPLPPEPQVVAQAQGLPSQFGLTFSGHAEAAQYFQDPASENDSDPKSITSCLFSEPNLGSLLRFGFDELEYYYPVIDRMNFYDRLARLFSEHLSHEDDIPQVPPQREHAILIALACEILSIATYLGAGANSYQRAQGDAYHIPESLSWHSESRRLLNLYTWDESSDIDLLCIQVLEVVYMNMLQRRAETSKAMALAVDFAFRIKLHDEDTWTSFTLREQEYRRLLWWTIFLLDHQGAILLGRPFIIRDEDFIVHVFTETSRAFYLTDDLPQSVPGQECLPWPLPSTLNEDWFDYIQFCVRWSKIATLVWDRCFALRASKSLTGEDVELIDALLMKLERDMPSTLKWNLKNLPSVVGSRNEDRPLRIQITIFERLSILRLVTQSRYFQAIRNNPKENNERQTARTIQYILSNMMDSLVGYMVVRKEYRPWITYGSMSLAKVSTWVAPILMSSQMPVAAKNETIASIVRARKGLQKISLMNVTAASVAMDQLSRMLNELQIHQDIRVPMSCPGVSNPRILNFLETGSENDVSLDESYWDLANILDGSEWEAEPQ